MHPEDLSLHSKKKFGFSPRVQSFRYAITGIVQLLRQEPNARIHAVASVVAIALGIYRGLSRTEWAVLVLVIGAVWVAEALNTAVEMLCDLYCDKKYHPVVKIIKDISAGAVLITALVSVAVGVFLFIR